jgi:hypothetical protein
MGFDIGEWQFIRRAVPNSTQELVRGIRKFLLFRAGPP